MYNEANRFGTGNTVSISSAMSLKLQYNDGAYGNISEGVARNES